MTTATPDLELSVVIPCLNEAGTIQECVRSALTAMVTGGIRGEVLVSDNGSTDGSDRVAREAGARVVVCPTRGYGVALDHGFRMARGRYLIMGDADGSYDFSLIPQFMERARMGADLVIGSRLRGRLQVGAMPAAHRYLGTPALTLLLNLLFGTRITDCNCGMRCISRQAYLALGLASTGMEYASEMIVKAAIQNVRIAEVPIDFYRDGRNRRPHLRPIRDGWRHLRLLLWHAPDHMMTLPGLVMLVLGLILVGTQLAGPVSLGFTSLDIHFMILGLTLSLVGTSAVSLGLIVGATTPGGRWRHISALKAVHHWYSIDRVAALAGVLAAVGVVVDGFVLTYWLWHDRGMLTALFTRLTLLGLLLIAMSVQLGLSALVCGSTLASDERKAGG